MAGLFTPEFKAWSILLVVLSIGRLATEVFYWHYYTIKKQLKMNMNIEEKIQSRLSMGDYFFLTLLKKNVLGVYYTQLLKDLEKEIERNRVNYV